MANAALTKALLMLPFVILTVIVSQGARKHVGDCSRAPFDKFADFYAPDKVLLFFRKLRKEIQRPLTVNEITVVPKIRQQFLVVRLYFIVKIISEVRRTCVL